MQRYVPATVLVSGSAENGGVSTVEQLLRQATPTARQLLRALITAQARHKLFLPEQPLLVAVSGGADSICLLYALYQLAPPWRLSLFVAHLDHALRPESEEDAAFVAAFAQQLALPFYSTRLIPGILKDVPGGLEVAARSARVHFLRQVAEQLSSQLNAPVTVATAHHRDDQAETLLMHLIQGGGLTGLAGMAWVGELPDGQQPSIRLVRPFLATSRAEIRSYLGSFGLEWREDSSNEDLAHLRNQLRHQVLPLLATINPNIHATLARSADLLAAEAEHAAQRDHDALAGLTLTITHQTRIVLDLFPLAQLDLATQRGVLRQALATLGVDLRAVGMEGIDLLLDQTRATRAGGPHPIVAGWAWTLLRHDDKNWLSLHRAEALPFTPEHPHLGVPLPSLLPVPQEGSLSQSSWQLHSTLLAPNDLPADWRERGQPWQLFCDAGEVGDLYLTTFQAGMSIAPLGMGGHQRALGDIFTDHKIPLYLRSGWPIVVNGDGRVIWLCGLVVAEAVRVQPTTRQVRRLLWQLETEATP